MRWGGCPKRCARFHSAWCHPSAAPQDDKRKKAFTLIELLVVISVIVLLMALLLPALQRAKKRAQAVVCQNTTRQWGILSTVYSGEHDGRLMYTPQIWHFGPEIYGYADEFQKASFLCPAASKNGAGPAPQVSGAATRQSWTGSGFGGTFAAWWQYMRDEGSASGWSLFGCSYGTNEYVGDQTLEKYRTAGVSEAEAEAFGAYARKRWTRATLRSPGDIPFLFDCAITGACPWETDEPPAYEEDFTITGSDNPWEPFHNTIKRACFDRHGGGTVNVAFLDGSARRVGLKELWTLKWYRQYDTAGPWTKAGGVLPEDWPQWMRRFKDY
ncbi:MAG: type II secretion system protein [Phycisphaerae bacterium]|nr:type II secretion system protein [Phycisphaerae bacterium]